MCRLHEVLSVLCKVNINIYVIITKMILYTINQKQILKLSNKNKILSGEKSAKLILSYKIKQLLQVNLILCIFII